jgi:formate dehydrogenase subunit gamma
LPAEILRFRASERQLHWAIAVPFMICYATAIVLVSVYNPDPTRPYRALFSWTHRLSGVCLFLLPLVTMLRHRRDLDLHLRNILAAWRWKMEDVRWLFLMAWSTIDKRITLPDQGKFNAGEKLNFMFLSASYPMYIITGFLIWLPGVAFGSWILHLSMAALATPLILGHVFMATVNPDTRVGLPGMVSGYVNRHWAEHHYRHWYNEHFWHLHKTPAQEPQPIPAATAVPAAVPRVAPAASAVDPARKEPAAPVAVSAASTSVKSSYNKALPAATWPPMMRPSPVNQSAPEST